MQKLFLLFSLSAVLTTIACKKDGADPGNIPASLPRTDVPSELRANWMFGKFSMKEYWSQDPVSYLGNALEYAIAFTFEEKGLYTQYFTSSSVIGGVRTYNQSVTKGTVEIDVVNKIIKTHPFTSHYKRTKNGVTEEERDMKQSELSGTTTYHYNSGVEPSDTRALYLTLQGTPNPLTFLQK